MRRNAGGRRERWRKFDAVAVEVNLAVVRDLALLDN